MASSNENNLPDLLKSYNHAGLQYRDGMAKKYLIDSILSDKTNIIDNKKMEIQVKQVGQTFQKFRDALEDFSASQLQLKEETIHSQMLDEQAPIFQQLIEEVPASESTYSDGIQSQVILGNIKTNENIINRLQAELEAAKSALVAKKHNLDDLRSESQKNEIKIPDKQNGDINTLNDTTSVVDSAAEIEFMEKNTDLDRNISEAEALFEGLKKICSIDSLEVATADKREGLNIKVTISDCSCLLSLDLNKRLSSITVVAGSLPVDSKTIVEESQSLPAPQDLRYAIFALKACHDSAKLFSQHLSELKKKCIVRPISTHKATLTLANGLTVAINVHYCYPEVPAGVKAVSVMGIGGWTASELDNTQQRFNDACFCTLNDAFDFLNSL